MQKHKILRLFFCFFIVPCALLAQNKKTKREIFDSIHQCESTISQNNILLKRKKFASATPLMLQVNNDQNEFGVLQIGKRKGKLYLYFKLMVNNTCLKNRDAIEIYFEDGTIYPLRNQYLINCDGNFVRKLKIEDRKKILNNKIHSIQLYTFNTDYSFLIKESDYNAICENIECIKNYKIKK